MIEFHTITLEDKAWIDRHVFCEDSPSADYNFGNMFIWDGHYRQLVCCWGDRTLTKVRLHGEPAFVYPIGCGPLAPAIEALREFAAFKGYPFRLRGVTEAHRALLEERFPGRFSFTEEARYADIITHVVDASNPDHDAQIGVVYETLRNLGVTGKPIITLFNKCDLVPPDSPVLRDERAERSIRTSMKTGEGLDAYLQEIERILNEGNACLERIFPFREAGEIQKIRKYGQLLEEKYTEEGIFVRAYVPKSLHFSGEEDPEE